MKKFLMLLLLTIAGVAAWYIWETRKKPKDETPADRITGPSKYGYRFNQSMNNTLNAYYSLSEAFVNWDSAGINSNIIALKNSLDSINYKEIADSATYQTNLSVMKNNLQELSKATDITAKRTVFNSFSRRFYQLLQSIQYDNTAIFLQKCPMAFSDTGTGVWLSKTEEIRNPYLGMHDPKYGKAMLECGETEDKIDFTKR